MDAAGCKQGQLNVIAREQRQINIGTRVDNGAELRCVGVQQGRSRRDVDRFGGLSDLQLEIDASGLVQNQSDRAVDGGLKSRTLQPSAHKCRQASAVHGQKRRRCSFAQCRWFPVLYLSQSGLAPTMLAPVGSTTLPVMVGRNFLTPSRRGKTEAHERQ